MSDRTAEISRSFVEHWTALYESRMGRVEPRLFAELGPVVAARGSYEPAEFAAVAHWKTPRSRPNIEANSAEDVRSLTALAFAAPERLQHRVLTLLNGVQAPTATALLAVAFPTAHTIIDVRSTAALERLGEWDGEGGYVAYLAVCRRLSKRLHVTLRMLDRALWSWSKAGYPDPPVQ